MLQQHNRNSGVKLPNCYSHAKCEKFLKHLIQLHVSKNLNVSKTKQDIEKLKILLRLVWKCCSVVFKIGSKIFSLGTLKPALFVSKVGNSFVLNLGVVCIV